MTGTLRKQDLHKGARIYYNGDGASHGGLGTITRQTAGEHGATVDIELDDGGEIHFLPVTMFSDEYLGRTGTEFVLETAYRKAQGETR